MLAFNFVVWDAEGKGELLHMSIYIASSNLACKMIPNVKKVIASVIFLRA